jgi:hypothetical protein
MNEKAEKGKVHPYKRPIIFIISMCAHSGVMYGRSFSGALAITIKNYIRLYLLFWYDKNDKTTEAHRCSIFFLPSKDRITFIVSSKKCFCILAFDWVSMKWHRFLLAMPLEIITFVAIKIQHRYNRKYMCLC